MSANRERFFAVGVALGAALGFVLGSVIALRVGDEAVDAADRVIARILHREEGPNFEVLLQ